MAARTAFSWPVRLVRFAKIPYSRAVSSFPHAAMVQRLARSPFKAKIRVRFPLAVPNFLLLPWPVWISKN